MIRSSFEFRDFLLQSFPETFSVPNRYAKHMMVVADLENGNGDAVEDAIIGAWELQSGQQQEYLPDRVPEEGVSRPGPVVPQEG